MYKRYREFKKDLRIISKYYNFLVKKTKNHQPIGALNEWILDNYATLLEHQNMIEEIYADEKLIRNTKETSELLWNVLTNYLENNNYKMTKRSMFRHLKYYQKNNKISFTYQGLQRIRPILSMVIIHKVKELCVAEKSAMLERKRAESDIVFLGKKLLKHPEDDIHKYITIKEDIINYPIYIEYLNENLYRLNRGASQVFYELNENLERNNTNLKRVLNEVYEDRIKKNLVISNLFLILKMNEHLKLESIYEEISETEEELNSDRTYRMMDADSKNMYRERIVKLAKKQKVSELIYVRRLIAQSTREKKHIGFYLLKEPNRKRREFLYFTIILLFTSAISYGLAPYLTEQKLLGFLILWIPSSEIVITILNRILTTELKPKALPKLDFSKGIRESEATMVVIPTILKDKKKIDAMFSNLESGFLANRMDHLYFALLGDCSEQKQEAVPHDEEVAAYGIQKCKELNEKYQEERFFFLYRNRVYHETEDSYLGWERKRGALIHFNRLLLNKMPKEEVQKFFKVETLHSLKEKIKYVITLDADTKLVVGSVADLVGTMAHPLNQPVLNKERNKVVQGYGILQPKLSVDVESSNRSLYAELFAGLGGFDVYNTLISNFYQDVFHEGSFMGKGIYHLKVYDEVIDHRFPTGLILSHDLVESNYLHSGYTSNIELFDDFCSQYLTDMTRHHRWMRGDTQVLPWLFPYVKDEQGKKYKNPLTLLERWKIFDNLRRCLIEFFLLVILLFAYFSSHSYLTGWSIYVLFVIAMPLIFYITEKLSHQFTRKVKVKPYTNIIKSGEAVILRTIISFTTLPYKAALYLDAIFRSLYRMIISKKHLLSWLTAEEAEKTIKNTLTNYIENFKANYFIIFILLLFTYLFGQNSNFISALCISLTFSLAPYITYYISKETRRNRTQELSKEETKDIEAIAHKTWKFFEENLTEEYHYLIPDNYQENRAYARDNKTSPTDIGFSFLAVVSAYELGFIKKNEATFYMEKILETIEKLDKWNGHLYNWYQTETLKVLFPHFVSSVDSGNFVACLIVTKEFLKKIGEERLANRCRLLIQQTDFSKLYTKEEVFSVGYNDFENECSVYKYNRFASESRLLSYVAIAKGDVPSKHWFCLDKTLTKFRHHKGVASWAGSLFEYYMPLIFMKSYPNTLLDESYDFAYFCQRAYMQERNRHLPWGISECAYDELDNGVNYKYKTFSVPYLKLQEVNDTHLVISPYSSILVTIEKPKEVYKNIHKLRKLGLETPYGFYESYDTKTKKPVRAFFSHHQGMILSSLTNYLKNGIIQDYFMEDTNNRAFEILTKEKIQLNPVIDWKIAKYKRFNYEKEVIENDMRYFTCPSDLPEVSAISNSKYTVLMNDRGNGFSRYKEIQLNRYRKVTEQDYGTFLYLKDTENGKIWSNTYAPINRKPEKYEVVFASDRLKYVLVENEVATTTEIIVSTMYNAEIRKVTIKNNAKTKKTLELTTYLEPTITENINDVTHRTFNNLFLESEYDTNVNALIMKRTLRNRPDRYYLLHRLYIPDTEKDYEYETQRVQFIGRNRTATNPIALEGKLSNEAATPIDPVMSMRNTISLAPEESREIYILNCFGTSRNQVIDIAKFYENESSIEEEFELATITNLSNCKKLNITGRDMRLYNIMLNYLYQTSKMNINEERKELLKRNVLAQDSLWKFGVSGDRPMITLTIHDLSAISLAKQLLKAYEYFKTKGIFVDVIIINDEKKQYEKRIKEEIDFTIYQIYKTNSFGNRPGKIFYIHSDDMTKEEQLLFNVVARLRLDSREHDSMHSYIEALQAQNSASTYQPIQKQKNLPAPPEKNLAFANGFGGFANEGKEYVITTPDTPTPWFNILANAQFGTLVSNNASGFTYAYNSQEFKLTSWTNDIVSFDQSEGIRINQESFYPSIARHGFGYTIFESQTKELKETLTEFVATEEKVKFYLFEIENLTEETKQYDVAYWLNPVLGNLEEKTSRYLLTETYPEENWMTLRNVYSKEYRENLIFVTSTEPINEMNGDKILVKSVQTFIELKGKEKKKIGFILGVGGNLEEIKEIKEKYASTKEYEKELSKVKAFWKKTLETVQVKTNDPSFDYMMNGWYLYQTIVGRILARAGFYQVSGAFGYRDQLQDTMNLRSIYPALARKQILKNASHQFQEGDVLHWWLEPKNFGLRSRFKDDYLWLVYATNDYIEVTEDTSILKEQIPFAQGSLLQDFEEERGEDFTLSEETASLYEHCRLAIERTLNDLGEHGLPHMGGGDWNDGMNQIGIQGKGESVWLAFFFYDVLEKFIQLTKKYDKNLSTEKYEKAREELKKNINEQAWDGEYYLRAFFDDGTKVGSKESEECKIDLISQSFSILSEVIPKERIESVLRCVEDQLVDKNIKIVKLLTPAFKNSRNYAGYIMDYPIGVRENGGQYTHAVSWYILSLLKLKREEEALKIFQMVNPIHRTKTEKDTKTYRTEPYVIAADIYSNPNHRGRGGWTWYTGSSGWFYRIGLENLLGFQKRKDKLEIHPQMGKEWSTIELTYHYEETEYHIQVQKKKEKRILIDGVEAKEIRLVNDKKVHEVQIEVKEE